MSRPFGSKNKPRVVDTPIEKQAGLYDYELTRQSNVRSYLWYFNPNENEALDYGTRLAFLNEIKYMVRNQPIVNRILGVVKNHTIGDGLSVNFSTGDNDFDKAANPALDNYWNNAFCLVNQYDTGYDVQKLLADYIMIYGEFFLLLTESQSGYPQFQIIEPENVSSPNDEDTDFLKDGCYIDSNYKILAYSVRIGEDKWQKIDAANIIHCKLARSGNSLRGISPFSSSAVSSRHLRDLVTLEIASAKAQSTYAFARTKFGGNANGDGTFGPPNLRSNQIRGGSAVTHVNATPTANPQSGAPILPNPPATQIINGGAALTLDVGEDLKPLTTQRVSAPFIASVEYLESQICYSVGLDYYFITKQNSVTTGEVRFSIADAVAWFRQLQNKLIFGAFQRLNIWAAAKFIKLGILPPCKGNIFSLTFNRPAILTVDRQRENTIATSSISNGLMTLNQYHDERGQNWQDVYDERLREWQIKNEKRKAFGLPSLPFFDPEELLVPKGDS